MIPFSRCACRFRRYGAERVRWQRLVVGCAALLLHGCVTIVLPGGTEDGEAIYLDACASCHGVDGKGGGPTAVALALPPPDLTGLSRRHGGTFPRQFVIETITGECPVAAHGTAEMPVWSQRFAPTGHGATAVASLYVRRRLELLADHIESLQQP